MDVGYYEDMVQAILFDEEHNKGEFGGIKWELVYDGEQPHTLKLYFPMDHEVVERGDPASYCQLTLESLFSETTNNDACYINLRVVSAHFDQLVWTPQWLKEAGFGEWVLVWGTIRDYLT